MGREGGRLACAVVELADWDAKHSSQLIRDCKEELVEASMMWVRSLNAWL
jgi:hypothetical protein